MKEFLESLFGAYKGRYQNKFVGTFLLFYIGLSWKELSVFLFLSKFSYEQFIGLWSIGYLSLCVKLFLSALFATIYLYASPIISLWIHKLQSDAITGYKIQNVKNEIRVLEEKERLENKKSDVLVKERDNLEMEVDNSRLSRDIAIYNELKGALSEQELRDMYFDLERKETIDSGVFERIKGFAHDISSAENSFYNPDMLKKSEIMQEKFSILLEDMKKNSGYGGFGLKFSSLLIKKMLSEKDEVINSYRDFIVESKRIFVS